MCFVLDVNSFHRMFKPDSNGYEEFKPLRDWLYNKDRTSLVIGGTNYRKEMLKMKKYFGVLKELHDKRKISEIQDDKVNEEERHIINIANDKKLDDPHIIALLCTSRCIIFASHDQRADPYIKMSCFYPKGCRPKIYRTESHASLLRDEHIMPLHNLL